MASERPALVTCPICDLVQREPSPPRPAALRCVRCGTRFHHRVRNSLARTAAFSLAALILYVPANVYPIMTMRKLGAYSQATIWTGVKLLAEQGSWLVAAVVFCASILVPLLKLLGLFYLVTSVKLSRRRRDTTLVYRVVSVIGRWSMLDVFLLSILVGLVKLRDMAEVNPGPGILAFAAVVILTLLASDSFDPRLLWDQEEAGP
jgi:paraquat-inducible protein A